MSTTTMSALDFILPIGTAIEPEEWSSFGKISNDISSVELLPTTNVMPAVVLEFAMGREGLAPPSTEAIGVANRVVQAAQANLELPDIGVNSDGELTFYFRVPDGRLLMAELDVDGVLWAGVHDDSCGVGNTKSELMMPAEEKRLISLFKQIR